jgi:protein quaking
MQDNGNFQRIGPFQGPPVGWHGTQGIPTTPIVKRVIRLDVPVDKYPTVSPNRRLLF